MTFRVHSVLALFLLAFLFSALIWKLFLVEEKDHREYQTIARLSNLTKDGDVTYTARQKRKNVTKEFLIPGTTDKRSVRIFCDTSWLSYEEKAHGKELIEKMEGVLCLMQEEIYVLLADNRRAHMQSNGKWLIEGQDPSLDSAWLSEELEDLNYEQVIRSFEAEKATYAYQSALFDADFVKIKRFILPGKELVNPLSFSPFMSGHVEHLFFSLKEKSCVAEKKVCFEHAFGTLYALEAELLPEDNQSFKVVLKGEVEVSLTQGSILKAPSAELIESDKICIFKGENEKERVCRLMLNAQDEILATSVQINAPLKMVVFSDPSGTFQSQNNLLFSADEMLWDQVENSLTLQGHVLINEKGYGQLNAEGPVHLFCNALKKVNRITCEGLSTFTRREELLGETSTLLCQGKWQMDLEKMCVDCESIEGEKISFEDARGDILTDRACLQYALKDRAIIPKELILDGDVQIINRFAPSTALQQQYAQYALADQARFYVETNELSLSSVAGKRVLLFDKINQLQVSAPMLKISRDLSTKKDTVRGVGDVRFVFVDREFERLKKRFQFEDAL